ncbi:MAG: branched-chain amino acid ABC transporter permease [Chloroflexia bacterium]|nr:branched-chain amino acid ABC transporter permease [Chloroflexia bacterium]
MATLMTHRRLDRIGGALRDARSAALLLLGLVIYGRLADPFGLFIVSSALVLSLLAVSVDLQWGYAGILNLGPAAYLGLGAYTYAITRRQDTVGSPTYVAFALAILLGIALAVVVAFPAFKARTLPVYYALITLAVALILQRWTSVSYDLTGGSNGLVAIPLPDFSLPGLELQLTTADQFFPLASGVVIIVYLACRWLTRSRFGRLLTAIRDDEEKVATLGYDVATVKLIVAAIAGALGALAGALYAPLAGTAHPSLFGIAFSVQAYVWVAVGGQGTLIGPILAAIALKLLENRLRGVSADGYLMIIAAVFMLVVIFLPRGIAGLFEAQTLRNRFARGRAIALAPMLDGPLEERHG